MLYRKLKTILFVLLFFIIAWTISIFLIYNAIGLSKLEKATYINKEFKGIIVDIKPSTLFTTSAEKENIVGNNIFGIEFTLFDGAKIFVSNGMIAYKIEQGQNKMIGYSYTLIEQQNKRLPAKKYEEFVIHIPYQEELHMKVNIFLSGGGFPLGYLN